MVEAFHIYADAMDAEGTGDSSKALELYKSALKSLRVHRKRCTERKDIESVDATIAACELRLKHLQDQKPLVSAFQFAVENPNMVQNAQEAAQNVTRAGGMRQLAGAAAVGSMAGMYVLGPMGMVAGGLGAMVMSTKQTKAGEITRAAGAATVVAYDRAKELNKEYHIVEHTKETLKKGYTAAKTIDTKYDVRILLYPTGFRCG